MEMTIVVPAAAAQFLCLKPSTLEKMRMSGAVAAAGCRTHSFRAYRRVANLHQRGVLLTEC